MPFTPPDLSDRPAELAPQAGETLAEWEARVVAYAAANPGVLTPVDAALLIGLATDLGAYTDSEVADEAAARAAGDAAATPADGSVTAAKVHGSLKPSGSAAATDESLRRLGTGATHAAAGDDARLPTTGQKNALAGTAGTPGIGNEFVTKQDANARDAAQVNSSDVDDIVVLTQAAYDALAPPDAQTLYVVQG